MEPLISICCITYNQEKYIAKTLESFLMQRTDFAFEILIHDDASQDRTPEIIKEYQKLYPNLIKPIFQTENQFSQGVEIDYAYNFSRASGKYIAYSEGDDYWTDIDKLQKQVIFMESHPEVSTCIHADKTINEAGDRVIGYRQAFPENHYLTMDEIIQMDGKFAQNSMVYRNRCIQESEMPDWYFDAPVSDFPLLLFLGLKGKIYYMNEVMSAYRQAALNSWTLTIYRVPEKRKKHYVGLKRLLEDFDSYTSKQFTDSVQKQIFQNEFILLLSNKAVKTLKTPPYQTFYQQLTSPQKVKLHLSHYFPFILKINDWLKKTGKMYVFKPKEVFPVDKLSVQQLNLEYRNDPI